MTRWEVRDTTTLSSKVLQHLIEIKKKTLRLTLGDSEFPTPNFISSQTLLNEIARLCFNFFQVRRVLGSVKIAGNRKKFFDLDMVSSQISQKSSGNFILLNFENVLLCRTFYNKFFRKTERKNCADSHILGQDVFLTQKLLFKNVVVPIKSNAMNSMKTLFSIKCCMTVREKMMISRTIPMCGWLY